MERNELITLEQAVKLTSRFDDIATELEKKKSLVEAMLVTEDSRKDAKAIRAQLNKESKGFAEEFKAIKQAVLNPWNEVETEYKEKIVNQYALMDKLLKGKIDEIEDGLKAEKETELMEFFEELKLALNLDFVEFSELSIKVGLSTSITACKKQIQEKMDEIARGINAIEMMPNPAELMTEYKRNGYNVAEALRVVNERHRELEQEQELLEQNKAEQEAEENRIEKMEAKAEVTVEEKKYRTAFNVYGTLDQLKALKEFLEGNGIVYTQR